MIEHSLASLLGDYDDERNDWEDQKDAPERSDADAAATRLAAAAQDLAEGVRDFLKLLGVTA